MTIVEVDRLHGRFPAAEPDVLHQLDTALARVADQELERALMGVAHAADHVCIDELFVTVELDGALTTDTIARRWADAIAAALARCLESSDSVVYMRTVDALADLVRSVARGDRSRVWAWRQVGLVAATTTWPSPADVAHALARRAELAPAVLGAVDDVETLPLSPDGWLAIAEQVHMLVGGDAGAVNASPAGDAGDAHSRAEAMWRTAAPFASQLPWRAASRADKERLATLVLSCASPALVHDGAAREAVIDWFDASPAAAARREPDTHHDAPSGPDGRTGDDDASARARAEIDPARRDAGSPHRSHDAGTDPLAALLDTREPAATHCGGVLFLVHCFTALDVVTEITRPAHPLRTTDTRVALAHVAASISGAALDDPAVLAVAGWHDDDDPAAITDDLAPAAVGAIAGLAARCHEWVEERTGDESGDLGWVWARRAYVERSRGWIDAELALDEVDLRIRLAGLDLDPGFVWWLGSVVRFRYA
jgi:hypothetical protein